MRGGLFVRRTGKVEVGKKFSMNIPVIHDIDWNAKLDSCPAEHTESMLACASDVGTSIYRLIPGTPKQCKWMGVGEDRFWKMYQSPESDGVTTLVKFHPLDGRILITASESGLIRLLTYDNGKMNFVPMDSYQCDETISSLTWHHGGGNFVAALKPSSRIIFFRLTVPIQSNLSEGTSSTGGGNSDWGKDLKLEVLGSAVSSTTINSKILTVFHPKYNIMYSCAEEGRHITVWDLDDKTSTWQASQLIECGPGVIGMAMHKDMKLLTTLHNNDVLKHWRVNRATATPQPALELEGSNVRDHANLPYPSGKKHCNSHATAVDARHMRIVSTGINESGQGTLVVYTGIYEDISRVAPFVWEATAALNEVPTTGKRMNCVRFNPNESMEELSFVTGGQGGFLHFWCIMRRMIVIRELSFKDEEYFYMGKDNDGRRDSKYEKLLPQDTGNYSLPQWRDKESSEASIHSMFERSLLEGLEHLIADIDLLSLEDPGQFDGGDASEAEPSVRVPSDGDSDYSPDEDEGGDSAPRSDLVLAAEKNRVNSGIMGKYKTASSAQRKKFDRMSTEIAEFCKTMGDSIDTFAEDMKTKLATFKAIMDAEYMSSEFETLSKDLADRAEQTMTELRKAVNRSRTSTVHKSVLEKLQGIWDTEDESVYVRGRHWN